MQEVVSQYTTRGAFPAIELKNESIGLMARK